MEEKPRRKRSDSVIDRGQYSAEEQEFLTAVDRLKRRCPFPTWLQVLDLLRELGWRKKEGS